MLGFDSVISKKLLYFIPGTLCNSDLWQRLWPLLSDDYQLVHVVIPAAGSMQQVVDSLVAKIRNHSAGESFSLLGFSLGGYLASAISCQFDQQLDKLMVVANSPGVLPEIELQARKSIVTALQGQAKAVISKQRVSAMLHPHLEDTASIISLVQQMDSSFDKQSLLHHLTELSVRRDLTEQLSCQNRPLWFVYGDTDPLVNSAQLQQLQQQSASIKLQQLEFCGHFAPLEQPNQLAQLIIQWMQLA